MGAGLLPLPPDHQPRSLDVGGWRVHALTDGYLRLDGGAMWGVVPAALWRAWTPPDADNTIRLALRPFLAVRGADVVLIEGGAGARFDAKQRAIHRFEQVGCLGAA
ncbi:MAG TPA: hypothetical protein VJP77_01980, partial [Planctomycetota bacterium]|nr:hypothetical protein [Planctomycetota bacterium]